MLFYTCRHAYKGIFVVFLAQAIVCRVFVSFAATQSLLSQQGHGSGSGSGVYVCGGAQEELQSPECIARSSEGADGQRGAGPSGNCSPVGCASLRGPGQLSKHLSVPWEAAMTPLSAAPLGVLQGSCLLAAEPGTHGGGHGRNLKVRIS